MTRINTNISSLNAQKSLARSNNQLQESLTRLSTGLRINTGKDDPAGLIASEVLRSDIISTQKAITNSERANQIIATADSALGQVSSLLNDIRGLVAEAANKGAMSDDQIAANQLQIDSSLSAINRISQTTKFQGRGLLDGSLDFVNNSSSISTIRSLQVNQATIGASGELGVNVDVTEAATQATLTSAKGDAQATAVLKLAPRVRLDFAGGTPGTLDLVAKTAGSQYEGAKVVVQDTGTEGASYDVDSKTLTLTIDGGTSTAATLAGTINGIAGFEFSAQSVTAGVAFTGLTATSDTTTVAESLTFTAATAGSKYNGLSVEVATGGANTAIYNAATNKIQVTLDSAANTDLDTVKTALNTALSNASLADRFTVTSSVTGAAQATVYSNTLGAVESRARGNAGISGYLTSGFSAATNAQASLRFASGAKSTVAVGAGAGTLDLDIRAKKLGTAADNVQISYNDNASVTLGNEYAVYDAAAKTLVVHYKGGTSTGQHVLNAINKLDDWTAVNSGSAGGGALTDVVKAAIGASAAQTTKSDSITINALDAGATYNHMQIKMQAVDGLSSNAKAIYDATANELTIQIKSDVATNLTDIKTAIETLKQFSASVDDRTNLGRIYGNQDDVSAVANTAATGGNTLLADTVVELSGANGAEVFNFNAGTSVNQVAQSINLSTDATGLVASQSLGLLTIQSSQYGSKQFAAVNVNSEGTIGTFKTALSAARANGTDTVATINGVSATADGNKISITTATLDVAMELQAGSTSDFKFSITGGGALFQLGPDVVANQQARLGIQSVNTGKLGGASGKLYQLASGEAASLANDTTLAAKIVDDAITNVSTLRGRLGAFQKTTIDTNIKALNETLEALTDAESSIRDADFAKESAAMTRAQILVQSGLSVLSIANQRPQSILSLLRG